jgi:hypothetical protein
LSRTLNFLQRRFQHLFWAPRSVNKPVCIGPDFSPRNAQESDGVSKNRMHPKQLAVP